MITIIIVMKRMIMVIRKMSNRRTKRRKAKLGGSKGQEGRSRKALHA